MSYEVQKRILDLVVAFGLIVVFLPFWILVPILIIIDSGKPVFFRHKRVGKNGEEFYLWKFRSMVPNADQILRDNKNKLMDKFKAGDWKMKASEDPRITPLGKKLRSFTIDEFPQLYNVIKGEMSMVGPRAYLREELHEQITRYPETKKHLKSILSVKPGITGPWQVSGRNEIPFTKRAKLDADYANEKSIISDIKILFKTPQAMFSKW
ncbi:MAG: sugar transferase [Pseudomonadales bacterium]|jgi:lipopolysaccharide/colanic/teichoic acid biosynthesis glycosyltransferase|nr:sugar transferase [Pseudomonadales bacterium]